ncbi:MAG: hypothetical protein LBR10_03440 [Prevotellaceae bacterium]|jgi:hypothetical protein|nr:hypothetical protein [Prevotellaceae bacterium]
MIDVFTEEIEVQIKRGVSNLYWNKEDLRKAWLRSGAEKNVCDRLFSIKEGRKLTKRELMDSLYAELRTYEYNKRLEISRNFMRVMIEHSNFVPLAEGHKIDIAETCALKLKQIIGEQRIKRRATEAKTIKCDSELSKIGEMFLNAS